MTGDRGEGGELDDGWREKLKGIVAVCDRAKNPDTVATFLLTVIDHQSSRIAALEAENRRLREALELACQDLEDEGLSSCAKNHRTALRTPEPTTRDEVEGSEP